MSQNGMKYNFFCYYKDNNGEKSRIRKKGQFTFDDDMFSTSGLELYSQQNCFSETFWERAVKGDFSSNYCEANKKEYSFVKAFTVT